MTNIDNAMTSFNAMAGAFMMMCLNPANFNDEQEAWAVAYRAHAEEVMSDPALSLEDTNDAIETLIEGHPMIEFVKATLMYDY